MAKASAAAYCAHPGCEGLAYRVGCSFLCRGHRQLALAGHAAPPPGEHWRRQRTAAHCTLCGVLMAIGLTDDELSEQEWFEQVRSLLDLYGWRWQHQYDSRRSNAGFPDIVAIKGSRLVVLELKAERGRVTAEQRAWLADFAAVGAETAVLRPSSRAELARSLAG